jgi:hypothetical protein
MSLQGVVARLAVAVVALLVGGGVATFLVGALGDAESLVVGAFAAAVVVLAVRFGGGRARRTDTTYW